jgi:tetratricopeptide (TPR) repeat protein
VEDAPLPEDAAGDPQEEGEEEKEEEEGEEGEEGEEEEAEGEEAKEEARRAERKAREEKHQWRAQLDKRKRAEAEAERLTGVTAFKAADWEGALDAFTRASELAPDDHRAHLNRSACLLKLGREREAVLAADVALHRCKGADAKAWYRRASAWLASGEFNECLADLERARRMEPADKAIGTLKAKAEEERETATFSFSVDLKLAQNEDAQAAGEPVPHPNQLRMGLKPRGDLRAVRTMNAIEAFDGASLTLRDDTLTLAHAPSRALSDGAPSRALSDGAPSRALSDGATRVLAPAFLDHRALFSLEACAKRSSLETLALHGVVLGAWGAAFLARGARLQGGAGLERLSLVECRLRDEGARSIGSLLSRGSRLVELELSANRIGDEGLLALATELGMNEFLQVL